MAKITMSDLVAATFAPMLESLAAILDKANPFADSDDVDLAKARLAPDMFTLAQQVQTACYFAVDAHERLSGGPPFGTVAGGGVAAPEPETSLAGMKAQIARTLERIRAVPASAFDGAEERDCSIEIPGGDMVIEMDGAQYLARWAIPHFYFHVVTAYDILRHLRVELGKQDYMSALAGFIRRK